MDTTKRNQLIAILFLFFIIFFSCMQLTVLLLFTVYSVLIHTLPRAHAYTHNHTSLLYHCIPPHHYLALLLM